MFDLEKTELPPPEVNKHQESRDHPGEMHGIKAVLLRVLNDAGDPGQKACNAQTYDHSQHDSNMRKDIVRRNYFIHQFQALFGLMERYAGKFAAADGCGYCAGTGQLRSPSWQLR